MLSSDSPANPAVSDPNPASECSAGHVESETEHLAEYHVEMLSAHGIKPEVAEASGARTILEVDDLPDDLQWAAGADEDSDGQVPGLLYCHTTLDGTKVFQYAPDEPVDLDDDGRIRKYIFPKGAGAPITIPPGHRERIGRATDILIAEGTKQTLAAASWAPPHVLVVGICGCWGWSSNQIGKPELEALGVRGRTVIIAMDGDRTSNPKVFDAADRLSRHLTDVLGVSEVRYIDLPVGGTNGIDDLLGVTEDRASAMATLIERASPKPGKRPTKTSGAAAEWFDKNDLKVADLCRDIASSVDLAVDAAGQIWTYKDGVFVPEDPCVAGASQRLGNLFKPTHVTNIRLYLANLLREQGRVLPSGDVIPTHGLINVKNGMLDFARRQVLPHDPKYLSMVQLDIHWDPSAKCPTFDAWLPTVVGDQHMDLMETAGMMLCPWIANRKVLFAVGPTRSGKSTFLRILEAIAGRRNTEAVTLHELANDDFAAAMLYGKVLNIAADLALTHVRDLSMFKRLLGDDLISAQRKYQDRFNFRNTAFMGWSANGVPPVSEEASAYMSRVKPIAFPVSFLGSEDPSIEAKMMEHELAGIFVRLLEAASFKVTRGEYLPTNPIVFDYFSQSTDGIAGFVGECTHMEADGWVSTKDLYETYCEWCQDNNKRPRGRNGFLQRTEQTSLGPRKRRAGSGSEGWGDIKIIPKADRRSSDGWSYLARAVGLTTGPASDAEDWSASAPEAGDRTNVAEDETATTVEPGDRTNIGEPLTAPGPATCGTEMTTPELNSLPLAVRRRIVATLTPPPRPAPPRSMRQKFHNDPTALIITEDALGRRWAGEFFEEPDSREFFRNYRNPESLVRIDPETGWRHVPELFTMADDDF